MKVIAAAVASDPEKYNEAFLGKPNEAYCAWIMDPEKWGGEFQCYDSCAAISMLKLLSLKCSCTILFEDW